MHAHPQTRSHWWHGLQTLGAAALLLVVGGALGGALVAHSAGAATAHPPVRAGAPPAPTISTAQAHAVAAALDAAREQAISRVRLAIVEVQNVGVGLGSGIILRADGYI